MTDKLTRRERERIIFDFLKGKPNPLYDVEETCHGKYVVKQKQIQIEEEESEAEQKQPPKPVEQSKPSKQQLKRERRRANRRAKADAYKILEQLNRLINASNNQPLDEEEESDEMTTNDQAYRAAPLVEQPNLNSNPKLSFKRKRLRF